MSSTSLLVSRRMRINLFQCLLWNLSDILFKWPTIVFHIISPIKYRSVLIGKSPFERFTGHFFKYHNFESSPILINFVFITIHHFSWRTHLKGLIKVRSTYPKFGFRTKKKFLKFLVIPVLRSPYFKALQCLLTIMYLQRMLYSIKQLFHRVE